MLSGNATQVFIGWDVPKGAKPIISKIDTGPIPLEEGTYEIVTDLNSQDNDSKVDNVTITRYEGATELYATYVDLQDKEGKYKLHGEFYKDGVGGIVGKVMKSGVECDLGLLGSSISMYENVNPTATTKSSASITVPQRSQWEIYWYSPYDYNAASQACGEACCAMLQEYYTGQHPSIWSIWVACGYDAMTGYEIMDYFYDIGLTYIGLCQFWTDINIVDYNIAHVKQVINLGRPMILNENSRWGISHWVILRGYNGDVSAPYFVLNDPNTLTGTNTMRWYYRDNANFNFADNVVYWVGGSDPRANGYTSLRD